MKILFIINPKSGKNDPREYILKIEEMAALKKVSIRFLSLTGADDDQLIQTTLKEYTPDRVIAAGGDGTIQLVARNLMNSDFPLALLPLGSANGLATSLDIPLKQPESIEYLFGELQTKPLDLLLINDKHICVHLADIGINARIVKEYSKTEESGMMAYAKHLLLAIKETPLMHYEIVTETETLNKEGYLLAFANTNRYGTGIHITEGSAHDGYFEIRNIPDISLEDAVKASLTRFNIFIDPNIKAETISCKQARIRTDYPVDFQIDGEYIGKVNDITVKILPAAITILLP
jgi:diacylglycerol kinase (ATP)